MNKKEQHTNKKNLYNIEKETETEDAQNRTAWKHDKHR